MPQSLLTEVMMLREEIEEADGDTGALTAVEEQVAARCGETRDKIAALADDIGQRSTHDKNRLRLLINSVKYYNKLLEEMPLVAD